MVISENPEVHERKFIINTPYIRAIENAGGIPILLPALRTPDAAETFADMIDGVLVPGGQDISPLLFGEEPCPKVTYSLADTDRTEMALIKAAARRRLPIFGICRGMQLINVTFGGTLIQDIESAVPDAIGHRQELCIRSELTHSISVQEGSLIAELLGSSRCAVNSFHHQAVKDPAEGFVITARAADGIAEAMEREDGLVYAVQWHPEELVCRYPEFRKLFEHLIASALANRK